MSRPSVTLFTGMRAYPLDPARPIAGAVAVEGDRIAAVGDGRTLADAFPLARRIDLGGRTVLPGLTDSHVHFLSYGLSLQRIDLTPARSLAQAVARVREAAAAAPKGSWVTGRGWDKNLWAEGRWPTRDDLDQVSAGRPVALTSKDGHLLWVNSAALEAAGIGPYTADPPGGEIARDASGHPTGILKEAAKEPILAVVARPEPGALRRAAAEATAAAHRMGIVGVHNMASDGGLGLASEHGPGVELLDVMRQLRRDGALGVRMWITIPSGALKRTIEAGLRTGQGDEYLRIGGLKIFADGTLGSQTASMLEPFGGQPGNTGIPIHTPEALADLVGRAVRVGLWPVIHAIGDRANRDVLDAFALHRDEARRAGVRFRIEHVQLLHPADLPRLAALGVVASMQPIHATSDRDIADRYWGARSRTGYAWRSLLRAGTVLAFGSDAPVETLDPWQGIYAAVTRRPPGDNRDAWYPEEALTLEEAVRAYTFGAAWASGEEGLKGTLSPGRLADFIVLDRDVMREPPEALVEVKVLATFIGGQPVYTADPLRGIVSGGLSE